MVMLRIFDFSSHVNVGKAKSPGSPKLWRTPRRYRYSKRNCPNGIVGGKESAWGRRVFFARAGDASTRSPLPVGKRTASRTAGSVDELILRIIVIYPQRRQMTMTPVFFVVGVKHQCHPAQNREEQPNTCRCQAKQDADPERERHAEKHPKKTSLPMAFVDVAQSWHNAEHRCD